MAPTGEGNEPILQANALEKEWTAMNEANKRRATVAGPLLGNEQTKHDLGRRIRLEEFEVAPLSDGRCVGRVTLAWDSGRDFVGTAEGLDSPHGRLRCAAEATAVGLEQATNNEIELQVLAIKAVEGYGTVLVVVSCAVSGAEKRFVGSCLSEEQPSRGAVLAVLHATNRLLSREWGELTLSIPSGVASQAQA